jgi:predicted Zn-dependent peptidase
MKEYQRKQLLERIDREGATVGVQIPDTIEVQGEEIDLKEFVFEIKRRDTYPAGERQRVENAKKNLRRERLQRRQRIENDEVDFEDGEELAESIIGISRALEALQQLNPDDIEGEAKRQEAADRKRWMSFLKQALGRDDASSNRGRL